mmetsp:Transcript_11290/g.26537  ORF Transcript_11290/g.26537 Transcript_11290/m.26537 type:complete len:240 (-) Transcript_11290:17-736(-)
MPSNSPKPSSSPSLAVEPSGALGKSRLAPGKTASLKFRMGAIRRAKTWSTTSSTLRSPSLQCSGTSTCRSTGGKARACSTDAGGGVHTRWKSTGKCRGPTTLATESGSSGRLSANLASWRYRSTRWRTRSRNSSRVQEKTRWWMGRRGYTTCSRETPSELEQIAVFDLPDLYQRPRRIPTTSGTTQGTRKRRFAPTLEVWWRFASSAAMPSNYCSGDSVPCRMAGRRDDSGHPTGVPRS